MSDDLIGGYLADLNRRLRVSKERKREILAEAADHLRESAAAGVSIGMTETEAQEAAISAFGSVRAVVRAHRARRADLAADLILAAWKLGWTGMFAIAASGFVVLAMNHFFGNAFVGQAPAGASYSAAACQHWLSIWHGAHTCAQAAMLENSSDAVSLRVIGGGLAGVVLLAGYLAAHRIRRRGGGTARLSRSALPRRCSPSRPSRSSASARSASRWSRSPAARSACPQVLAPT